MTPGWGWPGTPDEPLARDQGIREYARAFARSGAPVAMFIYRTPGLGWLRVRFEAATEQGGAGPEVRVQAGPAELPHRLTARELDVLTLLAIGLSNTEIAAHLVSSPRTVSTHVEHILAKLGQASRTGAAAMAVERGYLKLPLPGSGPVPASLLICELHAAAEGPSRPAPAPAARPYPRRKPGPRPLRIGSAFPLNGPAGYDGQQMLTGSALAIAEIGARGGIGGRPVQQVVVNVDIFSPSDVDRAFGELAQAGVDALTSGYLFPEDRASDLARRYGAPYLHAMTSQVQADVVRDNHDQYQNVFQVCPTEVHYGPGFIRFLDAARSAGWRPDGDRIAFVETTLPSCQMVNARTISEAERSGWQISSVETVPGIGARWPEVVGRLESQGPVAVMIAQVLAGELAEFQRLAARRLPGTVIYAIYAPSVPEFLRLAGTCAEGLVWATVTGTYSDGIGRRFRADYRKAFGRPAGRSHAGIAYDEVHLIAQAWMAVPDPADFASVCRQLRQIRYRGVNGSYFLDNAEQSGLCYPDNTPDPSLGQAHLVLQIQDGVHRIISPAPYAESRFRVPGSALSR